MTVDYSKCTERQIITDSCVDPTGTLAEGERRLSMAKTEKERLSAIRIINNAREGARTNALMAAEGRRFLACARTETERRRALRIIKKATSSPD